MNTSMSNSMVDTVEKAAKQVEKPVDNFQRFFCRKPT